MQPQENPCRVLLGLHDDCTEGFFLNNCRALRGLHGDYTEGFFLKNLYCLEHISSYTQFNTSSADIFYINQETKGLSNLKSS